MNIELQKYKEFLLENRNKFTNQELATLTNLSSKTISDFFYTSKVRRISYIKDKITLNLDFFKEETVLSYYWAGFIAADGNIGERAKTKKKIFALGLAEVDLKHLDYFLLHIKAENISLIRGVVKNKFVYYRVCIYREEFINPLESFNIVPRKSLTLQFPHHKNPLLLWDFIRGYFDGDGCITVSTDKRTNSKFLSVSCVGTEKFTNSIMHYIGLKASLNKQKNVFVLRYSHINSVILAVLLYNDTFSLERKKSVFEEYISQLTPIKVRNIVKRISKIKTDIPPHLYKKLELFCKDKGWKNFKDQLN